MYALASAPAHADMILSQVIVDLHPDDPPRGDIEVFNDSDERLYVAADPFLIENPGLADEHRTAADRPDVSGLLVSPQRMVLAPGERRTIRIAIIGGRSLSDRIYRVAIRPVTGEVSSEGNAVKVLVGYDTLVIVRPDKFSGDVSGVRNGQILTLHNNGNTAQELFDGKQCDASGEHCQALVSKRLYPSAILEISLPYSTPVKYKTAIANPIREREF